MEEAEEDEGLSMMHWMYIVGMLTNFGAMPLTK